MSASRGRGGEQGKGEQTHQQAKVALGEIDHGRVKVGSLVEGRDDDAAGQGRRDLADVLADGVAWRGVGRGREAYPGVPSEPHFRHWRRPRGL